MITNLEYRKGILFVRLNGNLTRKNICSFENDVIPIILKAGIKFIALNLENLNSIDNFGISSLTNIYDLIKRNNGRFSLCNIKDNIKLQIDASELKDKYYKAENELLALELFKL